MIIDGKKLADYLEEKKISKKEFLNYLRESDQYSTKDEELGYQVAQDYNMSISMDIYKGKTELDYETSRKLIYGIGAEMSEEIIEEQFISAIMGLKLDARSKYAYKG